MNKALLAVIGIIVFIGLLFSGTYNNLVRLDEGVKAAWSQVENVYQRRLDLIPNLVETVKGYAAHESQTLSAVTEARARATSMQISSDVLTDPAKFQKFQESQAMLSSALSRLLAVAENYPDLKANQNFLALQEELSSTENKIGFSRQNYNDSVMEYNTRTQSFPANLIAGWGNFQKEAFFEIEDKAQREVPQVKF